MKLGILLDAIFGISDNQPVQHKAMAKLRNADVKLKQPGEWYIHLPNFGVICNAKLCLMNY